MAVLDEAAAPVAATVGPALAQQLTPLPPDTRSGHFAVASDLGKVCPKCLGRYPSDFKVCPRDATPLEAAAEDGDPLHGAVLGGTYRVHRVLGEGGMGKVYEASHLRLASRRFAVKVLHAEYARHQDVLGRFQREAEAAASIAHSHVLEVFDVARTEDGRPYIVGEFLEGEDFHEYLERVGKVDLPTAAGIARQIAGALQAAHDAGVVHRDLKPENVYVVRGREVVERPQVPFVKLLDFGISKINGRDTNLTRTGMIMGTPNYMAPEQARGERVDHRVDVYALGAILYRMITGKRAFEGTDAAAVMAAVMHEEPRRPRSLAPTIPEAFEIVVQKAMAKDARERYQDMRELDRDLAAFEAPSVVGGAGAAAGAGAVGSVVVRGTSGEETTRTDQHARTFLSASGTGARPAPAAAGHEAKLARPTIVALTPVIATWLLLVVIAAAAGTIRALANREVTESEVMLMTLFSAAALVTPLVLWIVHVARSVWSNSVRAMELAADMRRFLAGSLVGYGLAAIVVRFAYTVPFRLSPLVASGWWDLLYLFSAAVAGAFGGGIGPLARLRRRLLNT